MMIDGTEKSKNLLSLQNAQHNTMNLAIMSALFLTALNIILLIKCLSLVSLYFNLD